MDVALHVLPVAILVDTRQDVTVGHVIDLSPELRVLVGFEHFVGGCIRGNTVEHRA